MELDVFTPLKDGPLDAAAVARAAGTDPAKTAQLLHALAAIGMMRFDGSRFSNSPEADRYLVRGKADYIGMRHHANRRRWESMLRVAETIRTGTPQRGIDYAAMSSELRESRSIAAHSRNRHDGGGAQRFPVAPGRAVRALGRERQRAVAPWLSPGPLFLGSRRRTEALRCAERRTHRACPSPGRQRPIEAVRGDGTDDGDRSPARAL